MQRLVLMPENIGRLRRAFFSVVLASVEFFVAFLAVIGSVPMLVDPVSLVPPTILEILPMWMVYGWAGGLLIGGLMSIAGIVLYRYRIERMGALTLAMSALIYTVALISLLPGSWLAFITYVVFVFAMLARYWVLGRVLKVMNRVRENAR